MSEISDKITTNAQQPRVVEVDSQRVEQHELSEQIKADRYIAGNAVAKGKKRGALYAQFRFGGTQ